MKSTCQEVQAHQKFETNNDKNLMGVGVGVGVIWVMGKEGCLIGPFYET